MSTAGGDPNVILAINDDGLAAYGTTRASSNMIVAKYASMLKGEGFVVVAFSPGVVDTSATSDDPGERFHLTSILSKTTDVLRCTRYSWGQGAEDQRCCLSPEDHTRIQTAESPGGCGEGVGAILWHGC